MKTSRIRLLGLVLQITSCLNRPATRNELWDLTHACRRDLRFGLLLAQVLLMCLSLFVVGEAQESGLQVSEESRAVPPASSGNLAPSEMRNPKNPQALELAAGTGNIDLVRELLRRGADPNAAFCDAARCTKPLTAAVYGGNVDVVKELLSAHAGVDSRGDQRFMARTALMDAAARGNANIVRVLIANGATVNARDSSGRTPLMWASMQGQIEAVRVLLASGADVGATDVNGKTAAEIANTRKHSDIAKLINKSR